MDLHVNVDRINELCLEDEEKAIKLVDILSESIDYFPLGYEDEVFAMELTIGKMLDILYQYNRNIKVETFGDVWYVSVAGKFNTNAEELTDALFLAVKQVL